MGKSKAIIVIVVLLLITGGLIWFVSFIGLSMKPLVVTAYDGPVATMSRMEDSYPDGGATPITREVGVSHALVYPNAADIFDIGIASGLKCEINSAPNVLSFEEIETITRNYVDDEAQTNTSENVAVQKVKCSMGVKISTNFGGLADAYRTEFWIKLEENSFSVFTGVEDSYAAILEVYTTDAPVVYGDLDIIPSAGGVNIDMNPIGEQPETPEWITRIYGGVQNLRVIEFPLIVQRGHALVGLPRAEAYADYRIGFDVILFGYWEQVHDYREYDPGIDDFWGDLIAMIIAGLWYIGGFVLTGLAVWKLKGRSLYIVLFLVWALVLWQTGVFDSIFERLGL